MDVTADVAKRHDSGASTDSDLVAQLTLTAILRLGATPKSAGPADLPRDNPERHQVLGWQELRRIGLGAASGKMNGGWHDRRW